MHSHLVTVDAQVKGEEVEVKKNRYNVRPLRDFSSAFEKRQIEKEQARLEQEQKRKKEEEAARIAVRSAIVQPNLPFKDH